MGFFTNGSDVDEAAKLLGDGAKNAKVSVSSSSDYGTYGSRRNARLEDAEDAEIKKVPLWTLFRYTTTRDKWIIFVGTISAIIHGAGFPLLGFVFGSMTDTFLQQAVYGFLNESTTIIPTVNSVQTITTTQLTNVSQDESVGGTESENAPIPISLFTVLMDKYAIYYLSVGLIVLVSSFLQAVCWEWACERQAYRLRQEFFYQVLRQEISWFDNHQTGDLALKLSDDLERIREGIGHKFSMIIQYVSSFIMGLVVGLNTSWQLTLVILSLTPLLAGASAFSGKMIATQSAREQQKYGKAGGVAEEVLSCIRTVASFGGERREIRRYNVALTAGLKMALKKYHLFSIAVGTVFFIMYGSYSLAFWYACQLLDQNQLSPGDVFTVFLSVLLGAFSLGNAIPFVSIIATAQGCGAAVFGIIDSKSKIDAYSKEGIVPEEMTGHIQFRNIGFSYPSRKSIFVLRNFDLDIQPGKIVAIVGSSGSGKSTIVNLILRFYDPDSGAVLVDGNDIKALNLAWLRHHIGYVAQEPVLFGTTIYDNIRYGRDDVGPSEIIHAAKMAYAHDFITALPQGYDTLVGERGSQLSGGQKQRIAIARALVRDPKILLLDESTSALDAKSEAVVQAALDHATKGRTTIIIAHRLSTVKDADVIYAINKGCVEEQGTHSQLMSKKGLYYSLVMSQMSEEDLGDISGDSADESGAGEESSKELSLLLAYNQLQSYQRRVRRKNRRARSRRAEAVLPDPDKARLLKEAQELNVERPSALKILKVNKPEWKQLILGCIGCIFTGTIMPAFAFFYSQMFSTFTKTGAILLDRAFFWSMMFLVLAASSFIGFWIRTLFVAYAGEYLTMRLRLSSFANVVRQPIGWFDKESNSPSRLATRLARDAPLVKAAAGTRLGVAVSSFVTVGVALGIMFYFGWKLALVVSSGFPVLIFAGFIQVQVQKSGQKKDAAMMEDAGLVANEAISNIRTVQSLAQERIFCEKYFEHLFPLYIEAHRQALIYGIAFAFSEAVIFAIYAGAFRYGAYLIQVESMEAVDVYRVFFVVAFCAVSVGQTVSWVPDYTKAKLAAGLIFHLLEQKSTIDPFSEGGLRPSLKGDINFKDVHFRYPSRPDVPVLRTLSFKISSGQTLALVGQSGCGKSTVVSLLERFYDVVGGHVLVDGYDVRSINLQHLRAHIGVVTQEPVVFDCSIRDNIAYGFVDDCQYVPEELIMQAARDANIHNFIMTLPNGYNTVVGERGAQLSGGEKQRIAIARALIRDPKILLLDEATSALDVESEKLVQDALDKARAGRTCIVVAHRLSTIQNADCIGVMSRGKIVEMGTHDQLKNAKGIYFRLTKGQQLTY